MLNEPRVCCLPSYMQFFKRLTAKGLTQKKLSKSPPRSASFQHRSGSRKRCPCLGSDNDTSGRHTQRHRLHELCQGVHGHVSPTLTSACLLRISTYPSHRFSSCQQTGAPPIRHPRSRGLTCPRARACWEHAYGAHRHRLREVGQGVQGRPSTPQMLLKRHGNTQGPVVCKTSGWKLRVRGMAARRSVRKRATIRSTVRARTGWPAWAPNTHWHICKCNHGQLRLQQLKEACPAQAPSSCLHLCKVGHGQMRPEQVHRCRERHTRRWPEHSRCREGHSRGSPRQRRKFSSGGSARLDRLVVVWPSNSFNAHHRLVARLRPPVKGLYAAGVRINIPAASLVHSNVPPGTLTTCISSLELCCCDAHLAGTRQHTALAGSYLSA